MKRRTATYHRSLRVNQVLRQVVAEELERLADADERFRMVTVTSVDTAADMRTATVFLATLEDDAAEALEERRPHLQRLIGAQVTLKRTPRLTFREPCPTRLLEAALCGRASKRARDRNC